MLRAAIKKGTAKPAEYEVSSAIPEATEPPPIASVKIEPSTGPMQGDHPAEKIASAVKVAAAHYEQEKGR